MLELSKFFKEVEVLIPRDPVVTPLVLRIANLKKTSKMRRRLGLGWVAMIADGLKYQISLFFEHKMRFPFHTPPSTSLH